MSHLRDPRGRAFDVDQGPSGHANSGHYFAAIGELPTPADIKRAEDRRIDLERQRRNRAARRAQRPTCGFVMARTGLPCARNPGHGTCHRSRGVMDSELVAKGRRAE